MATQNEILRVNAFYEGGAASDMMNVFYFIIDDGNPTDAAVVDDMQDWLTTEWGPRWAAMADTAVELVRFTIDVISTAGLVVRSLGGDTVGVTGTEISEVTAAGVSAYLLAYTDTPKQRGSKYVPGMAESNISDGVFNAATLAKIALLLAEYLALYTGTGDVEYLPGILSRTLSTFKPFIDTGAITDVPAYQRRRKPNTGS